MFYEPRHGHGLPYDPFKAIIAPRPIGWISTVDTHGRTNLAPYSFFNAVHSCTARGWWDTWLQPMRRGPRLKAGPAGRRWAV